MASLASLVSQANDWLSIDEIPDYPGALNGLQLENSGEVSSIAAAVDACEAVIGAACDAGADLLVVHHGLFWNGAQKIENASYRKLKRAIEADLAIYSAHIPLDVHATLGNNAGLWAAIDESITPEPFFPWKGVDLGLSCSLPDWPLDRLIRSVSGAVGHNPHVCRGGEESAGRVGIITGGAGSEIAQVAAAGIDTFITGEGPHWSYTAAEELGVNVIYAGHYSTETFGVRALASRWCQENSDLEWSFIDHPTGL
ncbi:MAG: Nif3-like dinuclear metal center hexameric protein [Verrucomicrobiota bacterium]